MLNEAPPYHIGAEIK